jgi:hypothetical protein
VSSKQNWTGWFWRDLLHFLVNRVEVNVASDQVRPIFNTIRPGDHHGIHAEGDHGVLTFRKYYQSWVDQVAEDAQCRTSHRDDPRRSKEAHTAWILQAVRCRRNMPHVLYSSAFHICK